MVDTKNYDHTATFKILPSEVLFNEKYFANILFFSAAASKFRFTIETELEPSSNAHLHNGTRIIF